jgi:cyclin-dependent kinase 7
MAFSPLVAPSPLATAPLKKSAVSGPANPVQENESFPQLQGGADREITEQLNDEVRHKYIKGITESSAR